MEHTRLHCTLAAPPVSRTYLSGANPTNLLRRRSQAGAVHVLHCQLAAHTLTKPLSYNFKHSGSAEFSIQGYVVRLPSFKLMALLSTRFCVARHTRPCPFMQGCGLTGRLDPANKGLAMRSSCRCKVPSCACRVTKKSDGNLPQGDRAGSQGACCQTCWLHRATVANGCITCALRAGASARRMLQAAQRQHIQLPCALACLPRVRGSTCAHIHATAC